MQVFLDSDGVLADFDKLASEILGMPAREFEAIKHSGDGTQMGGPADMWNRIYAHDDFFYHLEKMPDADELVTGVEAMGYEPIVLTGVPSKDGSDWAIDQKIRWYEKHFPHLQVICCKSKDKLLHMMPDVRNVLIDDWTAHKSKWERAGGTFIVHTSAEKSLDELAEIRFAWNYAKAMVAINNGPDRDLF